MPSGTIDRSTCAELTRESLLTSIRDAFTSDSTPKKNIALRMAYDALSIKTSLEANDMIERLRACNWYDAANMIESMQNERAHK